MGWLKKIVCAVTLMVAASCAHHKKNNDLWLILWLASQNTTPETNAPANPPVPPVAACPAKDLFKDVTMYTGNSTVAVSAGPWTYNSLSAFIAGWDFAGAPQFHLSLSNKTAGYKYFLTAYGVYDDATGHQCEVFFQRWGGSNLPVENFDFTSTGMLSVNGIDYSLVNPSGGFYDFSKTYIQIIVFDANGNAVTDTDTANVTLTSY